MSLSKNDRNVRSESGKSFHEPDVAGLVREVAAALRDEFARLTQSNERAVRNWFEGKNGPSGANLVILMRHSDRVLRTVLQLADRPDLVVAVGLTGLRQRLIDAVAEIDGLPSSLGRDR